MNRYNRGGAAGDATRGGLSDARGGRSSGRTDADRAGQGRTGGSSERGGVTRGDTDRPGSGRGDLSDRRIDNRGFDGRGTRVDDGRTAGDRTSGGRTGGDRVGDGRSSGRDNGGRTRGNDIRGGNRSSGADNLGRQSPAGRGRIGGLEHTRPLRDLTGRDPRRAGELGNAGRFISRGTRSALNTGFRAGLGVFGHVGYGIWDNGFGFWNGYGNNCSTNYWYWYALGGYGYSFYTHPFSYPYYSLFGYWPRVNRWYPRCYYPTYYSYPAYTASVITRYIYDDYYVEDGNINNGGGDTYVYVNTDEGESYAQAPQMEPYYEGEPAQVAEGTEPVTTAGFPAPAPQASEDTVDDQARAGGQYLTLGDQAFRDGRFADAVHFYARAAQFKPQDGVVWLVLSDGLFATGDYHYGAFALRKALEFDPGLAQSPVDKRSFYSDGSEFDRQLAVLEGFVNDHPSDSEAILMLAANYLFGGRPAAAVDLLGQAGAETASGSNTGRILLEAAKAVQYGR